MKIFVFIPNMLRPRNVMLLATDIADYDDATDMIAPFETDDVVFDRSETDDTHPDLMHYIFTHPERATFIIAPDHVTHDFVASKFDTSDD